jgi:hypothetical protein
MKIIEQSTIVKEVTCAGCKSKLGVEVGDIRHHVSTDYTGDSDDRFTVTCPVCRATNHVGDLPYALQAALKGHRR